MNNIDKDTISSALLDSMDAFAQMARRTTKGTLTVETEVVSIEDENKGLYNVKYLGNIFTVKTLFPEITYQAGDLVYVIIPDGNFDKNKIILSLVSPKENNNSLIDLIDSRIRKLVKDSALR